ncbi:MAG: ABC transporter ATP-binding protein [Brevinema sp.]
MDNLIQVQNLCKDFGGKTVLTHVSLEVAKGEIIGLLGANGAGKTTLLKLMSGLLEPTEGEITLSTHNPWNERDKVLKHLGILIEAPVFYEHLTAYENLSIHLEYMNIKADIDKILSLVGLDDAKNKQVSKYSLGMKQRLAIARCISHKPKILLLDEPINGLDPVAIKDIRELFIDLKKSGITIILSSHILSEILQTAESVVIMANGNLQQLGTIDELKKQHGNEIENYLVERMRG